MKKWESRHAWLRNILKLYQNFWELVEEKPELIVQLAEEDFDNAWKAEIPIPKEETANAKIYEQMKKGYVAKCVKSALNSYTNDIITANGTEGAVSSIEVAFIIFQLYYSSRDGMGIAWSKEKNKDSRAYFRAVSNLRNVSERMQGVMVTQCDALDLIRLYRTRSDVMLYLDPSYLKPEDAQLNLGEVYKMSYSYQDHNTQRQKY